VAFVFAASCLCLALATPTQAEENHWTGGGGDGLWSNPTNWSLARAPLATDDVFIDLNGTYSVNFDRRNVPVSSLRLGAASGSQTLTSETWLIVNERPS